MILNPEVLIDLAFEDLFRALDRVTRKVFAFRHDTDTHHVIVQGNVPEPAFLWHESDRRGTGVDPRVAFGPSIVSPDRDFVQLGITDAPMVAHGGKGFFARTIQRYRCAHLHYLSIFKAGAHAHDFFALR